MAQKTLIEKVAQFLGIKDSGFAGQLRQAESELLRMSRELRELENRAIGQLRRLESITIEQLRGGGSYDLTSRLMSDAQIKANVQRYFLGTETNYKLPIIKEYTIQYR